LRPLPVHVEPRTISEQLLREGSAPTVENETEKLISTSDFHKVKSLCLSFNNILEIENLSGFSSLTTLRLDNNIIDRIQNIDHFSMLTWLDLSFNNIIKMEGLENLTSLSDLTLCNNNISVIEGLDNCEKIQVLSLANNNICETNQIEYLRRFKSLQCLALEGNEVCKFEKYNIHVLAYLPTIKYLDFKQVNRDVDGVQEYNTDELTELREYESNVREKYEAKMQKESVRARMRDLFIFDMQNVLELEDELFEDEDAKLPQFTWYNAAKLEFIDKWKERAKALQADILPAAEKRRSIYQNYLKALSTSLSNAESSSRQFILNCQSSMAAILREFQDSTRDVDHVLDISDVMRKIDQWKSKLIQDESNLHVCIKDSFNNVEGDLEECCKTIEDRVMTFFQGCAEFNRGFISNLQESSQQAYDAFVQEADDMMDEEQWKWLSDREGVQITFSSLQDALQMKVEATEDKEAQTLRTWVKDFVDNQKQKEQRRNRLRVTEILEYILDLESEISAIERQEAEDADDY